MLRPNEPLYAPETPVAQCEQTYLLLCQLLRRDLARYPQPPTETRWFLHPLLDMPGPVLVCPQ